MLSGNVVVEKLGLKFGVKLIWSEGSMMNVNNRGVHGGLRHIQSR